MERRGDDFPGHELDGDDAFRRSATGVEAADLELERLTAEGIVDDEHDRLASPIELSRLIWESDGLEGRLSRDRAVNLESIEVDVEGDLELDAGDVVFDDGIGIAAACQEQGDGEEGEDS